MSNKRKVAYFYDDEMSSYHYGSGHFMKPKRLAMTHSLINHYKLYSSLYVYEPNEATRDELTLFHSDEYLDFLQTVSGQKTKRKTTQKSPFIGDTDDCPCFPGVYNFSQKSAGGSIDCAYMINEGVHNICVNWGGGLHHAKKGEASGFCYVNDIVLCILVLLRYHPRVLYIDIDVHHGDGVEEAFYLTNRVMTVSFHQYGNDFFPGTGHFESAGKGEGLNYALNVPLQPGIDDQTYCALFKDIIKQVVDKFQPNAIVLQCGGDSISGDKLGGFNLSTRGHAECVDFTLKLGLPTVLLGGGGYTVENVSRCWANETAVALGVELDNKLPPNEYSKEFRTTNLHIERNPEIENKNSREYLDALRRITYERLKLIEGAPGILVSAEYPEELMFQDGLDFLDMKREMTNAERMDEMGYDVAPKNPNSFLTSKPSIDDDISFHFARNEVPSSVLIPKVSQDLSMEIEGNTSDLLEAELLLQKETSQSQESHKQTQVTEDLNEMDHIIKNVQTDNNAQMIIENAHDDQTTLA